MKTKILLDTSAWICSFRKEGFEKLKELVKTALDENLLATSGIIVLELLQGATSRREYERLRGYLEALHFMPTPDNLWLKDLAFSLKRKGVTVPTTDILIAAVAIEYQCTLLHYDKHFEIIARYSNLGVLSL